MENTSGHGASAAVPLEIDRWNWGAFLLTWIWGVCNSTFIALLMFVPFVNFVMPFVLGARGSAWAWRNRRWESVDAFKAAQRRWAWWGLGILLLSILAVAGIFAAVFAVMKNSEPYQLGVRALGANRDAIALLGQPLSTGLPLGSVQTAGPTGEADLSFSVSKARRAKAPSTCTRRGSWAGGSLNRRCWKMKPAAGGSTSWTARAIRTWQSHPRRAERPLTPTRPAPAGNGR